MSTHPDDIYFLRLAFAHGVGSRAAHKPVSYTHLDVYKRQRWNWSKFCPACQRLLRSTGQKARKSASLRSTPVSWALRLVTVSYTHLWEAGQKAFEAAIKQRQGETGARKQIFPPSLAWLYPLALLAQGTPKHLELARKYCVAESGKRDPSPHDAWGRWVNAIDFRLGKACLLYTSRCV